MTKYKQFPIVSVIIPTYNRKEKLVRLIHSVIKCDYPKEKLEIIVVDDASTDGTNEIIRNIFPQVNIIINKYEKLLAETRNIGVKHSNGDFIFLIDDDNIVDFDTISNLVVEIDSDYSIGIIAPIMYYFRDKKRIWCAGIERNMFTSRTNFIGRDQIDNGQFNKTILSIDFPNAFMVRKDVFHKVGLFDNETFSIHYDEADFGERVRRAGYSIVCNPRSKIWHDMPTPGDVQDKLRFYEVHNETRAYYTARNRIIFHKKYSKWWEYTVFIMIFNWIFTIYYLKIILFHSKKNFKERSKISGSYLKGIIDGIKG